MKEKVKIGNEYTFSKSGNVVKVLSEPNKKGPYKGYCEVERVDSKKKMLVPVECLVPVS